MLFELAASGASVEHLWLLNDLCSLLVVHKLGELDLFLLHLAFPKSFPQPVDRHDLGEKVPVQHRHPLAQCHANLLFQGLSRNCKLGHSVEQNFLGVQQLVLLLIAST